MHIRTVLAFSAMVLLVSGCASNSVLNLMNGANQTNQIIPTSAIVEHGLKAYSIRLDKVYFDPHAHIQTPAGYSDELFLTLLRQQVQKGFAYTKLESGISPANAVDIAVEEMKFTIGRWLIPDVSILRVRIEVRNATNRTLMRGGMESRYVHLLPGHLIPISIVDGDWAAASKMIPAVAIAINRTLVGLQQGKPLDQIEVFPDILSAGSVIMPDVFLEGSPYGISQLIYMPGDMREGNKDN